MPRRKGFTLVELMVVIGVITLLASMLIPVVAKAHRYALRSRMKADLAAIGFGLEAYRQDHRDYPRLTEGGPQIDGACLLCWALASPGPASQDGADGPGFRTKGIQGQVYGPYVNLEHFRVSGTDDTAAEFVDRNDHPFHYCPANLGANVNTPYGYVDDAFGYRYGPAPLYDHAYFEYCLDLKTMRRMLGDANANGQIDPGETPIPTLPYILWSAGPNGVFGFDPDNPTRSDDVTNFLP